MRNTAAHGSFPKFTTCPSLRRQLLSQRQDDKLRAQELLSAFVSLDCCCGLSLLASSQLGLGLSHPRQALNGDSRSEVTGHTSISANINHGDEHLGLERRVWYCTVLYHKDTS